VVVVGATVVVGAGTADGATVVAPTDVGVRVVAIASDTGGAAGKADFLALPPQEARRTSVRAPAKVFNFDMRRR
jgi:hypothetical protein